MFERTVEHVTEWKPINDAIERCRDMLDPTLVVDWENCPAQCSADLALIARYFVNTADLAQLRKDAESPTTFLLEHPDGRLCVAFGLTATEAVLSIGADENPDEWVICDEKKAGRPMRVPR